MRKTNLWLKKAIRQAIALLLELAEETDGVVYNSGCGLFINGCCFWLLDCEEFEIVCAIVKTIAAESHWYIGRWEKKNSNKQVLEISRRQ